MRRAKHFLCESDIYPHRVVFYYGPRPSPAAVARLCQSYKLWSGEGKVPDADGCAACVLSFNGGCFVWIDSAGGLPGAFVAFAHELMHVITHFQSLVGCKMTGKTDEMHAYYAGWLAGEFIKGIRR